MQAASGSSYLRLPTDLPALAPAAHAAHVAATSAARAATKGRSTLNSPRARMLPTSVPAPPPLDDRLGRLERRAPDTAASASTSSDGSTSSSSITSSSAGSSSSSASAASTATGTTTSSSASAAATASVDPCGLTAASDAKVIWTVPDVLSCYSSFGLLESVRNGQIEALKSNFQMHPYLDQMKSSDHPFFTSHVDLLDELEQIRADRSIVTEHAFHSRIVNLVKSLRDGHTAYLPTCFQAYLLFQPWIIAAKYPGGDVDPSPVIYLRSIISIATKAASSPASSTPLTKKDYGGHMVAFWRAAGIEIANYVGWTVSKINGLDAVLFIQQEGDREYGVSRTKDTRFNKMLPNYKYAGGKWSIADSGLYQRTYIPPDFPTVWQYELSPPANNSAANASSVLITVPWAAVVSPAVAKAMTSRDTYYSAACVSSSLAASGVAQIVPAVPQSSTNNALLLTPPAASPAELLSASDSQRAMLRAADVSPAARRANMVSPHWDVAAAIKTAKALRSEVRSRARLQAAAAAGPARNDGGSSSSTSSVSLSAALVNDTSDAFYDLGDGVTGVWVFAAVAPKALDEKSISVWMASVLTGLTTLESRGLTRLIIDVSNNPGGVVCAGQAFLKFLFPTMEYMNYDVRLSPLVSHLVKTAFAKKDTDSFYTLSDVLVPSMTGPAAADPAGVSSAASASPRPPSATATPTVITDLLPSDPAYARVRGGSFATYSARFEMNCSDYIRNASLLPQLKRGWEPRNMAVVSNGLCGSTCSNIVRVLRDQFKVPSYVYGGRGVASFQPTSYEGGKLIDFSAVLSDISTLLKNSTTTTTAASAPASVASATSAAAASQTPSTETSTSSDSASSTSIAGDVAAANSSTPISTSAGDTSNTSTTATDSSSTSTDTSSSTSTDTSSSTGTDTSPSSSAATNFAANVAAMTPNRPSGRKNAAAAAAPRKSSPSNTFGVDLVTDPLTPTFAYLPNAVSLVDVLASAQKRRLRHRSVDDDDDDGSSEAGELDDDGDNFDDDATTDQSNSAAATRAGISTPALAVREPPAASGAQPVLDRIRAAAAAAAAAHARTAHAAAAPSVPDTGPSFLSRWSAVIESIPVAAGLLRGPAGATSKRRPAKDSAPRAGGEVALNAAAANEPAFALVNDDAAASSVAAAAASDSNAATVASSSSSSDTATSTTSSDTAT
ncbi:hypothetical protein HK405_006090, partial [Cladochytrium tenue]